MNVRPILEVLVVFSRLGVTSFGGPVAHLGYFREELVARRKWVEERTYGDLVGLCQFLPGPASSQLGISLGMARAGLPGGLAAWIGFTMPSALLMILFAYGVTTFDQLVDGGWLRGLKIVAVAVVALAAWGMAKSLTPDRPRITVAVLAAAAILAWQSAVGQIVVIAVGGLIGWALFRQSEGSADAPKLVSLDRRIAVGSLAAFLVLLIGAPIVSNVVASGQLAVFDSFYRSGSLVFGGGHVVLPLLQREVVPPGWVTNDQFVAGYGAAQAVPGPLFSFAAYLGTILSGTPSGWYGGLYALAAIYVPSFLLVTGALPFWDQLRRKEDFRGALKGINAVVVGLIVAALYDPVWTSAILRPADFALALGAFGLLAFWKWPPWLVVVLAGLVGAGLNLI